MGSSGRIQIIRTPISRANLSAIAELQFGDMVKAVVDIDRVMAIGGELHSDEESVLLDDGGHSQPCGASTCITMKLGMPLLNSIR